MSANLVTLLVSRELLMEMFALGDREIVGVKMSLVRDQVKFILLDKEAPDGVTKFEPVLYRNEDGSIRMEPHYS